MKHVWRHHKSLSIMSPFPPKPLYLLRKLDFAVKFWGVAKAETFVKNKFGEITSHRKDYKFVKRMYSKPWFGIRFGRDPLAKPTFLKSPHSKSMLFAMKATPAQKA